MNKKTEPELTFKEKIILYLNSHWKAASILLGVLVLAMAGILILDLSGRKKEEASAMAAEDIQKAFDEWKKAEPEDRADEELNTLINRALSDYPHNFAAQRALFTRGLMALEKDEWNGASASFNELAEKWPESYLAPVSLANAAGAFEQAGNMEQALASWQKLADNYSGTSANVPEALFNIARLNEKAGNNDAALEGYKNLESLFPSSRWTDLAKTRILILK